MDREYLIEVAETNLEKWTQLEFHIIAENDMKHFDDWICSWVDFWLEEVRITDELLGNILT